MRIVQTFWSGHRKLLEHGYGWPFPEYNLMSWVLSCHSLRKFFDEVVLYTDSEGKRILVDELQLPYTDVQIVFDDFDCLPQHWALAKIKTYSLQQEPFLHIDGDIVITQPIPADILSGNLIVQNREIGTIYYKKMIQNVQKHPQIYFSGYIGDRLRDGSLASYNMGFFGGSNLRFIHQYCEEVFHFMSMNSMNDSRFPHSQVDCNVLFEQVFLAILADREQCLVKSILKSPMKDKGYTRSEFCDLDHFEDHPFFHMLGGHKRNCEVQQSLARATLRMYPEKYLQILSLFSDKYERFDKKYFHRDLLGVERRLWMLTSAFKREATP